MSKNRQQKQSPPKPESQQAPVKKPRGRPRKLLINENQNSSGNGHDIRPLIEKIIAKKKLQHYKEALEQLQEIYEYLTDSIEFGEYFGYKKCTIDELQHIISEIL